MKERYKHYATDEILELEIYPQTENYKIGIDSKNKKYKIRKGERGWQIEKTSFFLEK